MQTGSWDFRAPTEPTLLHITQLGRRCGVGGHASRPGSFCSPLLDTSSARERPTLLPQTFCPLQTPRAAYIMSDSETAPDLDPFRSRHPTTDPPVLSCWAGSLGPCSSQRPSDPVATLAIRLLFQLRSSWEEKHELLCAPVLPAAGVCLSQGQVALGAACCPYVVRPLPSLERATISATLITFWSLPLAPRFQGAFW